VHAFELRPGGAFHTFMRGPDGGTRCTANAMHPDAATRDKHAQMGFFAGWNPCIDQLEAFAQDGA
jgi:uncharacterized protein YndB with AHSA1/START domain